MESEKNCKIKENKREEMEKVIFDREAAHVEFHKSEDFSKNGRKSKKEPKSGQEKKNMSINVDLLKAAFLALGHFGPGEDGKDDHNREIHLSFTDLSYSVKKGITREVKLILNNVSGEFLAGELTAIVGPSGCGKSSLLNILAGFTTSGVSGSIKVNETERDLNFFSSLSCYIMQNDDLNPFLTAEEAMMMAANLKLGPKVHKKKHTVKKILESLGLLHCRQVVTAKLSGGQRKRLAIALELISNPPVMFLDEPTSGLDSSSSKQCITLLKDLAKSGRTIICSLHQPSATLFEMLDHLYVMEDGKCLYSGHSRQLLNFLASYGLRCPNYYNPADFRFKRSGFEALFSFRGGEFVSNSGDLTRQLQSALATSCKSLLVVLEVATMAEYKEEVPKLVKKIENGKCTKWRKSAPKSGGNSKSCPQLEVHCSEPEDVPEPKAPKYRRSRIAQHTYPTSFWTQFYFILVNNFRQSSRNMFFTHLQVFVHMMCGVVIGFLFFDIGNDAVFLLDNFGFQFFCLMWNMFTSYSAAVSFYPQERPILVREHFNKWYSLRAYFFATNVANLPLQILCSILFTTISYFMTSQPCEMERFGKFSLILLLVAFVGQGIGYLVGSAMNVQNASIFGPLFIAPFLLFSGYFVLLVDSPNCLKWLFHISYYKYALEGVMDAVFGNDREKMKCSEDYCHYKSPKIFLRQLGMDSVDYWFNFCVLLGLSIILRVLSYFILRFRLNYFRS